MRTIIKELFKMLPSGVKLLILSNIETRARKKVLELEKSDIILNQGNNKKNKIKKTILIYHLSGLSFAGTERSLQVIAEGLSEDYEVLFLHATDMNKPNRGYEVEKFAKVIDFKYSKLDTEYPGYIYNMNPHIKNIINDHEVDLVITAGAGKTEYPIISITDTPIIMINIFGAPLVQKNIKKIIFISQEVLKYSENYTGKDSRNSVLYIPVSTTENEDTVISLRQKLNIPDHHFIFGRIGRPSDEIFDEIGIRAFQLALKENANLSYVIVSPPPILKQIVTEENIKNVYFISPTADQKEIWSFMYGIDALAHFRFDGETQGVNMSEAMYAGKPIISHKSHIWNAHLEYLNNTFSRVVEKSDIEGYKNRMLEFYKIKNETPTVWNQMCLAAKSQANQFFNKNKYIESIKSIVKNVI